MAADFHSRYDISALPAEQRSAFRDALRLATEKAGQVWIVEDGQIVGAVLLASRLPRLPPDEEASSGGQG